jgi:hypothetical protein
MRYFFCLLQQSCATIPSLSCKAKDEIIVSPGSGKSRHIASPDHRTAILPIYIPKKEDKPFHIAHAYFSSSAHQPFPAR